MDLDSDVRGRIRLRVIGINAPEVHKRGWTVGCSGPEAATWAAQTLPAGQRVAVIDDPTQDNHDRYGRTLGYLVLPDGRDFSVEAARAGMAQSVTYGRRPAQKFADIEAAQADAQAAHRGLWGPPCWGAVDSVPE